MSRIATPGKERTPISAMEKSKKKKIMLSYNSVASNNNNLFSPLPLSLSLVPPPCCTGEPKDPSLEHTDDT